MSEIISIYGQTRNYSGIYKLNFPNGKCYIGQSINIIRRMREHNCSKKDYPVANAIRKYGPIKEFELLEEINSEDVETLNEREKYYIEYYNSTVYGNGYNLVLGGVGATRDLNNPIVLFIKEELSKEEKTTQEIAEEAGVSIFTVWKINNGETYREDYLNYPIRKRKVLHSRCLTDEEIKEIIDLLRHKYEMRMEEIGKQYHVSREVIERINKGNKPYYYANEKYPIRPKGANFQKFSEKEIDEIINLLKTTKLTQIEIAEQYGCFRKLIGEINSGKKYFRENEKYPIRETRARQGRNNQFIGTNNTYSIKAISLDGQEYICDSFAELTRQTGLNRNTARNALFTGKTISQGKYEGWKIMPLLEKDDLTKGG